METRTRREEIITGLVGDNDARRELFLQSASFRHGIEQLAAVSEWIVDMVQETAVAREEHITEMVIATEGEAVAQRIRALGGLMDPEALAELRRL